MTAKIHGFTVKTFDESDGEPRLLGSSVHFGGAPRWVLLDDEALAGFVQKERSPWGHCWLSSRDIAEDAAREVRGIVCAVEVDEGGAVTVREILGASAVELSEPVTREEWTAHGPRIHILCPASTTFDAAEALRLELVAAAPPGATVDVEIAEGGGGSAEDEEGRRLFALERRGRLAGCGCSSPELGECSTCSPEHEVYCNGFACAGCNPPTACACHGDMA